MRTARLLFRTGEGIATPSSGKPYGAYLGIARAQLLVGAADVLAGPMATRMGYLSARLIDKVSRQSGETRAASFRRSHSSRAGYKLPFVSVYSERGGMPARERADRVRCYLLQKRLDAQGSATRALVSIDTFGMPASLGRIRTRCTLAV